MRHFARSIILGVLILGSGIAGIGAAVAQEDAAPTAVALPPLFQAWLDTYEAEDAEAFAALYTPDGVYEDMPSGDAAVGRDAIIESATDYFTWQDDYVFTPTAFYEGDDWAVMQFLVAATDVDTGIRVTDVPTATVFRLQDGLISHSSDYYDAYGVAEQLGLLPEEE